jgi:beta-N-acetylhexosaminidase
MEALSGTLAVRARDALDAGCDVILQCSGDMTQMEEVAAVVPPLAGAALRRADAALAARRAPVPVSLAALDAELAELLA